MEVCITNVRKLAKKFEKAYKNSLTNAELDAIVLIRRKKIGGGTYE